MEDLVESYASHTLVVPDAELAPTPFPEDPFDAAVVATAKAARVAWLVSGDRHLLEAVAAAPYRVLTVAEALARAAELRAQG